MRPPSSDRSTATISLTDRSAAATDRSAAGTAGHSTPAVVLRLSVSKGGSVAATLKVRSNATRHLSKGSLALQRHAQRLIDARKATQNNLTPFHKPTTIKKTIARPEDTIAEEFMGEQLLFVHFIPPSLRKPGKEKFPWIVHATGGAAVCQEAHHVHFRSVRNFETFEGTACGQVCACSIAQHHLRGVGCLRWDGPVAVIESTEVAVRKAVYTQTDACEQRAMQTQTAVVERCAAVQTEEDAVALRANQLCAENEELSAKLHAARANADACVAKAQAEAKAEARAALLQAQREHEVEVAKLHERQQVLEAEVVMARGKHDATSAEVSSLWARIAELEAAALLKETGSDGHVPPPLNTSKAAAEARARAEAHAQASTSADATCSSVGNAAEICGGSAAAADWVTPRSTTGGGDRVEEEELHPVDPFAATGAVAPSFRGKPSKKALGGQKSNRQAPSNAGKGAGGQKSNRKPSSWQPQTSRLGLRAQA